MKPDDKESLEQNEEALYLTLGLLVRHLHVARTIEACRLIRELRLMVERKRSGSAGDRGVGDALCQIADSFARDMPAWNEARKAVAPAPSRLSLGALLNQQAMFAAAGAMEAAEDEAITII